MITLQGKNGEVKIFTDLVEETAVQQVKDMADHEISENATLRFMPDIHSGKGATVGTTIRLSDKFDQWKVSPNIVGVDVGCFTADTKVKLLDGRSLSFSELVEEDNLGKENFIFGVEKDGSIKIAKVHLPRKVDTVTKLAFVTLDNGETIKCTLDHKFVMRDGEEVEAKDLVENSSLMPLYIEKAQDVSEEERNFKLEKISEGMGEYLAVYNPKEEKYKFIHVLADSYNEEKDPRITEKIYDGGRKSFVRHHKDFNKENNNPTNIERMGFKEHWKCHADNLSKTNAMGLTGFKRAIQLDPELPSRAGKARAKATWEGPNAEKNFKDKSNLWKKMNASGALNSKEQRERSRQRQLENNTTKFKEQNKDPNFIFLQRIGKYSNMVKFCISKFGELNEENWNLTRKEFAKNSPKYESLLSFMNKNNKTIDDLLAHKKNHKVVSVKIKCVEPTDVYCLTNFDQGNFALDAGVFVNNCAILMYKVEMKNNAEIDLAALDSVVNALIPAGFNVHEKAQDEKFSLESIEQLTFKVNSKIAERINKGLGTLGGGNHFIELGKDEDGAYWLSVHSGSRNLGVQVAKHHQDVAIAKLHEETVDLKGKILELKNAGRHSEIQETIKRLKTESPSITKEMESLAFLQNELLKDYLHDMDIAQKYAARSREIMLNIIVEAMDLNVVDKFDSVHNFIEHDNFKSGTIRKGATSAKAGERLVIPLNMRDGSLICVGKGNSDWNESAPHGAGRLMSRSKAKEQLNFSRFQQQMEDVYSTSVVESTIDEAPDAYKPAQSIVENIKDSVEILSIVKPVYNFKAH